ncbi:polyphosphate--glucose phosphotransferase [Gulosibacter molinativorax]|uniref:ROK family protein n=1 Tax=Gulosibacter molinativorax TaxID=256821 RepID=A0ABT7C5C4_9MICO|nr:ROK family protein [Gulosibacter molinativorax]MDJ1370303.1 ROK family protein [Gulosibacter molinativorax]QUY61723.1 Polyphosphate glucokinase [Gulosibacter molinativorax]
MAKKQDRYAVGIDIGGTGIKGALVDLKKGALVGERKKVKTPEGAPIDAVKAAVRTVYDEILGQPEAEGIDPLVGLCMPSVIRRGVAWTAANIAQEWVGFDARTAFSEVIGKNVSLMNDADAAGYGEVRYGEAADNVGSVLVLTLGTGIGSALIHDGRLYPNTELGHMELDGHEDYEKFASAKVREREELSFEEWGRRLSAYFQKLQVLLQPDEFIISGGISKQADDFIHLIEVDTPVKVAKLKNNAGIIGAALLAVERWD